MLQRFSWCCVGIPTTDMWICRSRIASGAREFADWAVQPASALAVHVVGVETCRGMSSKQFVAFSSAQDVQ